MRTAAERGLDLRHMRRRCRLALARLGEPGARRPDGVGELPIPAREQDLFPPAHLVAKPLVAARLGGLPLQRAALLLDLEDDVVDARQVLLGGFELELGGAAARLVLRDAGRLFDQLAPIGRTGAENQCRSCPAR